jgi:hypothetical protein
MNQRILTGATAAAAIAALAVLYKFPPAEYSFYPRCMIYTATHWLCPGCGATRALYALLHFDVKSALHYNALFTLFAPFALAWIVFCCYRVMRYDQFPRLEMPRSLTACLVVSALLFAIARNTIFVF